MSIFSKLRRAKQAADSQKDKRAATTEKPKAAPYKHIPTHAASDALLGAPATWREQDKKAIKKEHQRRSQYNLSRNPSSLSNVTTLNRDQSFTSAGMEQRKHQSVDWASNGNSLRRTQLAPIVSNSSRYSQVPSGRSSMRKSPLNMSEQSPSAEEGSTDRPSSSIPIPSKDVKFYLPSSREESPSNSSKNSNSSSGSRDSSFHEAFAVPTRHPARSVAAESPSRPSNDEQQISPAQPQQRSPTRMIAEGPRLPVVVAPMAQLPISSTASPITPAHQDVDLSFLDFGIPSSEIGTAVAVTAP